MNAGRFTITLTADTLRQRTRQDGDCWIWQGRTHKGYGMASGTTAHRLMYERAVGPIPEGAQIDHLCRRPLCINPSHLEAVSREENVRRHWAQVTHCRNGHEITPENTYDRGGKESGRRRCRICALDAATRYRARKRRAA